MLRTLAPARQVQPVAIDRQPLRDLLANSEDEFYGSLQRIWNNVVQLEDLGLIHEEHDKFIYAYRFAEAELHRAFLQKGAVLAAANPL